MPPRSHLQQFIAVLTNAPNNRLSVHALAMALGSDWDEARVEQKARQFDEDDTLPLGFVRGGFEYTGTERCREPAIYKQLRRGIKDSWATKTRIPRVDEVYITCRSVARGEGAWTTPDLVISSTRNGCSELHAIEAEQPTGFDVRSVYQAFEQGRGAHWAWVFHTGPAAEEKTLRRVRRAAKDLGVGVVHAPKPSQPSQWETIVPARPREPIAVEERSFRDRLGIEPAGLQVIQVPG